PNGIPAGAPQSSCPRALGPAGRTGPRVRRRPAALARRRGPARFALQAGGTTPAPASAGYRGRSTTGRARTRPPRTRDCRERGVHGVGAARGRRGADSPVRRRPRPLPDTRPRVLFLTAQTLRIYGLR